MAKIPLKIIYPKKEGVEIISDIAVSLFNARSAIEINKNVFNIDAGLNNTRAYLDASERSIKFACRYDYDKEETTEKIMAYAIVNGLNLVDARHVI